MVLGEAFLDTVLSKNDALLFMELFRIYPLSEVEDYFSDGCWDNALLRLHYKLFFGHREMAGAPDPPQISEIVFPDLPTGFTSMASTLATPEIDVSIHRERLLANALKIHGGLWFCVVQFEVLI
jgi:hypothetical protein